MNTPSIIRNFSLHVLLCGMFAASTFAAPPIKVELATPSAGEQATISLDVTIDGSGFEEGATIHFFVTGTENPGGIVVTNSRFVSRKQMVATIDIAADANLADYDIELRASGGRRGKGHTLFRVVEQGALGEGDAGGGPEDRPGDVSLCAVFQDGDGDALRSDGGSAYCDEIDGVWTITGLNGNLTVGAFDSKKFNRNERFVNFKSDCGGIEDEACNSVTGRAIEGMWTGYEYDSDGNPIGNQRLQWLEMAEGDIKRVSLHVNLGSVRAQSGPRKALSRGVAFSNTNGVQIGCSADAPGTSHAWLSCNGEDSGGFCNAWILSSFDQSGGSNDALACLKREGLPNDTIEAPFELELFTMP